MMRFIRYLAPVLLLLTLLAPGLSGLTQPAAHAAPAPAIQVTANAVLAGSASSVTIHGTKFTHRSAVTLRLDNTLVVGSAQTGPNGAFTAKATIPTSIDNHPLDIGKHTLTATDAANRSAGQPLSIVSLTLSPSRAPSGMQVTISGTGFLAAQPMVVRLGGKVVVTCRPDGTGAFSDTFMVPAPLSGQQPLVLQQDAGPTLALHTTFAITQAALSLSPSKAGPGQTISVSGTGFAPEWDHALRLDGQHLSALHTNGEGAFGPIPFTIPSGITAGQHTITVHTSAGHAVASTTLAVNVAPATLTLAPNSGVAGATPRVSGSGFQPGETVHIMVGTIVLAMPTANVAGQISAIVTLPRTLTPGTVTLQAVGQTSHLSAAANYTIPAPSLYLSQTNVLAGATLTVTGRNFAAREDVVLALGGTALATARADSSGNFVITVTVPTIQPAGASEMAATGQIGHQVARASLAITAVARIGLSTTTVPEGGTIIVTGMGFGPGEPVVLSIPGVTLQTVLANYQGAFSANVTIPVTAPVTQITLTAIGQQTQRTASSVLMVTQVQAQLTLSAGSVVAGSSLQVNGSGFRAGEQVRITLPGHILATVTASAQGAFTNVTVTLPAAVGPGAVIVSANGLYSQKTASAGLTITAAHRISLNTTTVPEGGTIIVTGVGFGSSEPVVLSIPGITLHTVVANNQGGFSATVTIPATAPISQISLTAVGQQTQRTASAAFTVTLLQAHLTLSTGSLVAGSSFQVNGSGFRPGEQVRITVPGHVLATVTTNSQGEFSNVTVTLPADVGPSTVIISTNGLYSQKVASAGMIVIARIASLSISPNTVTLGTQVRIEGGNFLSGEQVALSINGSPFATAIAGANGSFVLAATLPSTLNPGSHQITASGRTSRVVASASVQLTAPVLGRVGSTTWYFAAGRTDGGFSEQIDVLNTNRGPVHGTITFFYGTDQTKVYPFTLQAQSRGTYDAAGILGMRTRFATMVQSDLPVAAAHTSQRGSEAMTGSTGVSTLSRSWYMAEGYTGLSFQEELDLLNPGTQAARVHIVWPLFNGKAPVVHNVVLAPHSHLTIPVNSYVDRASHATVVSSDQPIVASRAMLFGTGQQGAHAREGVTQADATLYFAEGSTANGFEEYLTILNPHSGQTAQVTASFYDRQGTLLATRVITVDPMHRGNIKVNDVVQTSAVATVLQSNIPVVAERSMYFGAPNGGSADGTVVFGRAIPSLGWAFASGDTRNGRSEFELLFNPNRDSSTIVATFYGEDGRLLRRTFTLPGHSRLNIDVTLSVPELARGQHGIVLQSINGVSFVAEQALYDNYMRNGSATVGTPIG